MNQTTTTDYVETYLKLGFVTTPLAARGKAALRDGWPATTLEQAIATAHEDFATNANVGIVLGDASGGLTDVDLDCDETRAAAPDFLPQTLAFGRGQLTTHFLFRCPGAETIRYKDPTRTKPGDKGTLIEIRSTGAQTMFPPSQHPDGDILEFRDGPGIPLEIGRADLEFRVRAVAAVALLARHWPNAGRHDAQLALAGALLQGGWSDDDTEKFLCAVCRVSPNADEEPQKRAATVTST